MFYVAVDVRLSGVEMLTKSEVNAAFKAAYLAVGKRWRRRYLPLHFGSRATQRYRYTLRNFQYNRNKRRFLGHQRPLEFSGEGKREAIYRENMLVTRHKCVVRLPRKFNLRPRKGTIRMADEIRRILPAEIHDLTQLFIDVLEHELRRRGAAGAWASPATSSAIAA